MCCAPFESTKLLLRDEPWAADDLDELNDLCDWLLEPAAEQGAAPSPQQPEKQRRLAATFPSSADARPPLPRAAANATALQLPPLGPAAIAAAPCAVALQPTGAPLASPFSAAKLQTFSESLPDETPLAAPPQPAARRNTRPRLSERAASAPASGTSNSAALTWVLAMGRLAEEQGCANPPPLACPWEPAALPSRPPSPPSGHASDLPAPRPARSIDHSSSGSVAADNGSPALCTAEAPRHHSLDLLELLGADPLPRAVPPPQLPPRSSAPAAAAAAYRGVGAYGTQRSAPLPQLPAYGSGYEHLPAARALPAAAPSSTAGLHRAASACIGRKRLCTWDEHPEEAAECWPAAQRSPSLPAPPAAWQQAQHLSAPLPVAWPPPAAAQHLSGPLPPTWQQAPMQRQPSLEDSFEAQRQKLSSLLAQLQQVRVALQHEAAAARPLAPTATAPLPQAQHRLAPPAASAASTLPRPALQAGHLSWPAGAFGREPSPFFNC